MSDQIRDMVSKIMDGDLVGARSDFESAMSERVSDALDAEKIKVAASVYEGISPEELDEESDCEDDDEDDDDEEDSKKKKSKKKMDEDFDIEEVFESMTDEEIEDILVAEDVESLDEISKEKAKAYYDKVQSDRTHNIRNPGAPDNIHARQRTQRSRGYKADKSSYPDHKPLNRAELRKLRNRDKGQKRAQKIINK